MHRIKDLLLECNLLFRAYVDANQNSFTGEEAYSLLDTDALRRAFEFTYAAKNGQFVHAQTLRIAVLISIFYSQAWQLNKFPIFNTSLAKKDKRAIARKFVDAVLAFEKISTSQRRQLFGQIQGNLAARNAKSN